MGMRWLDNNDNWTRPGISFSDERAPLDEWVRLETIGKVTDGVAKAVILIVAAPLEEGEEVYTDDVSCRLLTD
jgi:hypothetical protein